MQRKQQLWTHEKGCQTFLKGIGGVQKTLSYTIFEIGLYAYEKKFPQFKTKMSTLNNQTMIITTRGEIQAYG